VTYNLQTAVNHAARELPEGWQILISVERGSGWAELFNADGGKEEPNLSDLELFDQVYACTKFARAAQSKTPEGQ